MLSFGGFFFFFLFGYVTPLPLLHLKVKGHLRVPESQRINALSVEWASCSFKWMGFTHIWVSCWALPLIKLRDLEQGTLPL